MIKLGAYYSTLRQLVAHPVFRSNITAAGSKALRHRLNIDSLPSSSIIKEAVAKSALRRWRLLLPLGAGAGAMIFGFMGVDFMDISNETTGNAGDLADGASKHHKGDRNEELAGEHGDDKTKDESPNKSTDVDCMDISNETTGNAGDLTEGASKNHKGDSNGEPAGDHGDDKTKTSPNKSTATHYDSADKSAQWKSNLKLIRLGSSVVLGGGLYAALGKAVVWVVSQQLLPVLREKLAFLAIKIKNEVFFNS